MHATTPAGLIAVASQMIRAEIRLDALRPYVLASLALAATAAPSVEDRVGVCLVPSDCRLDDLQELPTLLEGEPASWGGESAGGLVIVPTSIDRGAFAPGVNSSRVAQLMRASRTIFLLSARRPRFRTTPALN